MKIPRVYIYLKIKSLLSSFFFKNFLLKEKLSENLTKMTGKKYVEFFGMCRTGLIVFLEFLKEKRPESNEIIVCSYNLKEMVEIIKNYNFKVNLIDIEIKNGLMNIETIKKKITNKTAAILYTNMFNDYEHAKSVKEICDERDILMIEDCAIYFGNFTYSNNKKIYSGSVGDVSIFSFGIMKNVCAIFGGSLLTSNRDIYDFISKKNKKFKNFSNILFLKKIVLFAILKVVLSRYIYNYLFFYIIKEATIRKFKLILNLFYPALKFKYRTYVPENYYFKIHNLSLKMIYNHINSKNFENEFLIRKENNKIYHNYFKNLSHVKILEIKDFNFQNFLDYPIIVEKKNELVNYLLKKGLETRIHFYSNCEFNIQNIQNMNSQFYEENIICLPSHSKISYEKITEYCSSISDFYGSSN